MKIKLQNLMIMALASVAIETLVTSCIRDEKPNINVSVTDMQPTVSGSGIVKSTLQENGVTLYADMAVANPSNLDLTVSVSPNASWSYVELKLDTLKDQTQGYYIGGTTPIRATILSEKANEHNFSAKRYIKVTAEAEGICEDDTLTQYLLNNTIRPGFNGWENNGQYSLTYTPGAHLYKIWSVDVLPAGIPDELGFDNWYNVDGTKYSLPYELVKNDQGQTVESNIWSSTNASIALMQATNPLVMFGARPTTDVATEAKSVSAGNTSAMLLTSNDIRYTRTLARPFLAGCCFIGEYDGSDNGALTCTHVGLPTNKAPKSLEFWYKYLPKTIKNPNDANDIAFYSTLWSAPGTFNVPGIEDYIGKQDKGFIRAVLYRTDSQTQWVDGETIRDPNHYAVVAYAEFAPEDQQTYKKQEIQFTYVNGYTYDQVNSSADLKNWKYNLAIYFASSYDGFRFISGADMTQEFKEFLYRVYPKISDSSLTPAEKAPYYQRYQELVNSHMGSQLYIDEMKVK